jgi:hypothetical protein
LLTSISRTADLECKLDGKTAATCTGSSSLGSHHREGPLTGPTETVWTKTFGADDVTWGVLTLATPGPLPDTTDIEDTMLATMTGTAAVPTSAAGRRLILDVGSRRVVMASLGAVVLGVLLG